MKFRFFVLYQQLCPRSGYAHLIHSKYNNSNIVAGIIQTLLFKKTKKENLFLILSFFQKFAWYFFFILAFQRNLKKQKKWL